MSAVDESKLVGRSRLSFANEGELDEFVDTLEQFEAGKISAEQWRGFRLLRGTYGQRQTTDASMLRVKIPQGAATATQLRALADVADRYSRGFGHITTRQNVQFHFMRLHDIAPAIEVVEAAGLTTREACGNSVRNVTCCPYAGTAVDEVFDVTPYSEALTRYFLRHPLSSSLPRKFKVAFEGCPVDHVFAAINDLGFYAALREGERGFRVTAGGGTAIMCSPGRELFDFLPAAQLLAGAEAVVRVFHRLGDYQHRNRNRMKYLIKNLGWERYVLEVRTAFAEVLLGGGWELPFPAQTPPEETAPNWPRATRQALADLEQAVKGSAVRGPGITPQVETGVAFDAAAFRRWSGTNVLRQRQPGYVSAQVTTILGDLTSAQFRALAHLAEAFGDGTVRVTPEQNLLFRWVEEANLEQLYRALCAVGLQRAGAGTVEDVTSCPGAESCKLAVTQSRGLGRLLSDFLQSRPEVASLAPDLHIKMSGCPNGCGQHHIAGIGFQGSIRKVDGRAVPQYFVMLGGGVDSALASFGRIAAKVPARRIPQALERLIGLYRRSRTGEEGPAAFFRRVDLKAVRELLADLEDTSTHPLAPEDFIDLGEQTEFIPDVQEGECAA